MIKFTEKSLHNPADKAQLVTEGHIVAQETGDFDRGLFMSGMVSSRIDGIPTVKELIDSMVDDAATTISGLHDGLIASGAPQKTSARPS